MTNTEKTRENNRIYQRKSREQNRFTEMENGLKRKSSQNVLPVEPKKQCMNNDGCFGPERDINKIIESFHCIFSLVQNTYVSAVNKYGTKHLLRNLIFIIINHVTKICCLSAI